MDKILRFNVLVSRYVKLFFFHLPVFFEVVEKQIGRFPVFGFEQRLIFGFKLGLENINILLMLAGLISFVEILQVKYLNNLIEQDHRFIKKITNPMMGFKAFHSAKATIDGIETAHMIRKGQLSDENIPAYKQSMALAG